MFYICVGAEILRIGRISSNTQNFIDAAKILIDRAKKQGGKDFRISRIFIQEGYSLIQSKKK